MFLSPAQNPKLMTSCEYASAVTVSTPGSRSARLPENLLMARSKLCQKRCTGLALAAVPAGELLEDVGAPLQDAEEAGDGVGVVAGVLVVVGERRRHGHAEGLGPDVDAHTEPVERVDELLVELGDRQPVVQLEAGL